MKMHRELSKLLSRKSVRVVSQEKLLIIFYDNEFEKEKLLTLKHLGDLEVKAFLPKNTRPKTQHCIVGVSTLVSTDEIVDSTGCANAIRVTKNIKGVKTATSVVILNFPEKVPDKVFVGYLSYKVKPYLRDPVRFFKCNFKF